MKLTDEKLKKDVIDQLYWDSSVDASRIKVEVVDGVATLSGSVPTYGNRVAAETDVSAVRGILKVENRLIVEFLPTVPPPADQELQNHAQSMLAWNPDTFGADITTTVSAGVVTLEGTVDEFWKKWKAENLIHNIRGVVDVVNHLTVVPTDEFVDKEIAKHIQAALDRDAYMFAEDINVEVENGKVSLSGRVPSWYARWRAFDIASVTPGVIDVSHELDAVR